MGKAAAVSHRRPYHERGEQGDRVRSKTTDLAVAILGWIVAGVTTFNLPLASQGLGLVAGLLVYVIAIATSRNVELRRWWLIPPTTWQFIAASAGLALLALVMKLLRDSPPPVGAGLNPFDPRSAFSLVVLTPLFEETLFRGFLLRAARGWVGDGWAVLLTSLGFAALHLDGRSWLMLAAGLAFAVSNAAVAIRTGSLVPGILLHGVLNWNGFNNRS